MTKGQILNEYFNKFMVAYPDTNVPNDAELPYMTYTYTDNGIYEEPTNCTVQMFFRTESEALPNKMVTMFKQYIIENNNLSFDDGHLLVFAGEPFAQAQTVEDDRYIKLRYINLTLIHCNR